MASIEQRAFNIEDLQRLARRRLPRGVYEFIERGAEDDQATRNNRKAFAHFALLPRVLRDVSVRDRSISLFGERLPSPILVAPAGVAGLIWHDGEVALARAAMRLGMPFTLSTASMTSMERIAEQSQGPLWFQLYMWKDAALSHDLVRRVSEAGYKALVVTVDTPVSPNREFNRRNGFSVPFRISRRNLWDLALHPAWLLSVMGRYLATTGMPQFENYPEQYRSSLTKLPTGKWTLPKNDALTWSDLKQLRKLWKGPLIVKGVLHPADAAEAALSGADAVIVSNHGGRNFDASLPPLFALSAVADRVGAKIPVIMDGGIRRGTDVAKALALGASAVMTGRAPLWGVAAAGEAGAFHALSLLDQELDRVLGSLGCASIDDIKADSICEAAPLFRAPAPPPVLASVAPERRAAP